MQTTQFDDASVESIDTKGAESEEGPLPKSNRKKKLPNYFNQHSTGRPTLH